MKLKFEVVDNNSGPFPKAKELPRRLYKGLITRLDREGAQFRVGQESNGQVITKTLTILVPSGSSNGL